MSRIWSFKDACVVAGELYGNILARDSDESGFKFSVDQLIAGQETVRSLAEKLCTSEEFREKFVMNQTPNELAKRILLRLCKDKRPTPEAIKNLAVAIAEKDWRVVVSEVFASRQYREANGDDRVPIWA